MIKITLIITLILFLITSIIYRIRLRFGKVKPRDLTSYKLLMIVVSALLLGGSIYFFYHTIQSPDKDTFQKAFLFLVLATLLIDFRRRI